MCRFLRVVVGLKIVLYTNSHSPITVVRCRCEMCDYRWITSIYYRHLCTRIMWLGNLVPTSDVDYSNFVMMQNKGTTVDDDRQVDAIDNSMWGNQIGIIIWWWTVNDDVSFSFVWLRTSFLRSFFFLWMNPKRTFIRCTSSVEAILRPFPLETAPPNKTPLDTSAGQVITSLWHPCLGLFGQ